MRCEGAENPPCKRCRQQSLECLFEKPNREASLTEAGLECVLNFFSSRFRVPLHCTRRIRDLGVARFGYTTILPKPAIQNTLVELVNQLRAGSANTIRSPTAFPPTYMHPSPNVHADSPGSMSTPVSARPTLDSGHTIMSTSQPGNSTVRSSYSLKLVRYLLILLNRCILVLL